MASTTLQDIYSKKPCPLCKERKLTTNSTAKVDEIMRYRCLNCGNEFFEDEHDRRAGDRSDRTRGSKDAAMGPGAIVLILMIATILAISLYGKEGRQQDNSRPVGRMGLPAQLIG